MTRPVCSQNHADPATQAARLDVRGSAAPACTPQFTVNDVDAIWLVHVSFEYAVTV